MTSPLLPRYNSNQRKLSSNNQMQSSTQLMKEYTKQFQESVINLNKFTFNLQEKVNSMLKVQQGQFVTSYKVHMSNVKDQLIAMEQKLKLYQQKVQYYQNQGRLSTLIKRIHFLEQQQSKLFIIINDKDKIIKEINSKIRIQQKQQKSVQQKYKALLKQNIKLKNNIKDDTQSVKNHEALYTQSKISEIRDQNQQQEILIQKQSPHIRKDIHNLNLESINTFSTQIPLSHYLQSRTKRKNLINTAKKQSKNKLNYSRANSIDKISSKILTDYEQTQEKRANNNKNINKSYQFQPKVNNQQQNNQENQNKQELIDVQILKIKMYNIQRQNFMLRQQNKKLILFNTKYANSLSQLGQFFIKSIQQLKKAIVIKRKLKYITLQQFKKQDKILLLSHLLANDQAISILYEKIFKPSIRKSQKERSKSVLEKSYGSAKSKNEKSGNKIKQLNIEDIIIKNQQLTRDYTDTNRIRYQVNNRDMTQIQKKTYKDDSEVMIDNSNNIDKIHFPTIKSGRRLLH